jgi:2-oxoglutarate dehydrogenase E1 component
MVEGGDEVDLVVSMPPNPSHLEAIDPVLEGMARAAGTSAARPGAPEFNPDAVLPILIHGDAAFPGQGVVAETLNLHGLSGYSTGGTIHIIANNQIGFTTDTDDSYSTLYASGLARGFKIPIIHVNADDPEACIAAARLAFAYREEFKRDFLIDLVGYRRYGHNEGDEPAFTQPVMYQRVGACPDRARQVGEGARGRGRDRIRTRGRDGVVAHGRAAAEARSDGSRAASRRARARRSEPGAAGAAVTAVPVDRLRDLNNALLVTPDGFHVHRKLERARDRRRSAFDDPQKATIDWAAAEELAFASILADGRRFESPARTSSAGPSAIVTPFSTTRRMANATRRFRSSRRHAHRSKSGTVRSAKTPRWVSSTATTCRRPSAS